MRIGIDLGGTKIEGIVLRGEQAVLLRQRIATPTGDYEATLAAVVALISELENAVGASPLAVGLGHPGSLSPATQKIQNANSTCLNARALGEDLQALLGREIRMANDANCLALSEAFDGAAAGVATAFAVILGTGVGGGILVNGQTIIGANAIAGEWGHNPLPWVRPEWDEVPGPRCWCGRHGCIETWLSGVGLAQDHLRATHQALNGEQIVAAAEAGDSAAQATLARFEDRLARALAHVINLLDPAVIVLGGGLSRIARLYRHVPALWDDWIFSNRVATRLLPAQHGDSSGVLGAARLWPESAQVPHA
jgi:fructokinase